MKGTIKNGDASQPMHILAHINPDYEYRWEVTRKMPGKTGPQHRLYFRWVGEIVKHIEEYTGYTKEEVHDFLKEKFLEPEIVEIAGQTVQRYTTKRLSVPQMCQFMDHVDRWATQELGIHVPIPQEMQLR